MPAVMAVVVEIIPPVGTYLNTVTGALEAVTVAECSSVLLSHLGKFDGFLLLSRSLAS